MAQLVRGFLRVHARRLGVATRFLEDGVERCRLRKPRGHRCEALARRPFDSSSASTHSFDRGDQRLRVAQAAVLGVELFPLARTEGERVEVAELPGRAARARAPSSPARSRAPCAARQACAMPTRRRPSARCGVDAAIGIEQCAPIAREAASARRAGRGCRPAFAGLAQLRDGGRAAVDPGAALAWRSIVRRSSSASSPSSKPASRARRGPVPSAGVELGADLGARGAFAHHAGIAAPAERELQRVDQDRLARAGLAGQHREAARRARSRARSTITKSRSDRRRSMADLRRLPSFQRSLRRSVA